MGAKRLLYAQKLDLIAPGCGLEMALRGHVGAGQAAFLGHILYRGARATHCLSFE